MKYKVGDEVKIRKDLEIGQVYGTCVFAEEMKDLRGKITRITEVNKRDYRIDSRSCYWTDEMFEDVGILKECSNMKYKVNDKVRIRKDLEVGELYDGCLFKREMKDLCGKVVHITGINENIGCYFVDSRPFYCTSEMFADIGEQGVNKRVVIDVDGNKVTARCGDKYGVARCHPDDDFDFFVGAKLALERLEEAEKPYAWLKDGMEYYISSISADDLYIRHIYDADNWDKRYMKRGIVFQTKEEAIECTKRMLAVVKQEG